MDDIDTFWKCHFCGEERNKLYDVSDSDKTLVYQNKETCRTIVVCYGYHRDKVDLTTHELVTNNGRCQYNTVTSSYWCAYGHSKGDRCGFVATCEGNLCGEHVKLFEFW